MRIVRLYALITLSAGVALAGWDVENAAAQQGNIAGRVTSADGAGLQGAQLRVIGTAASVTAREDGRYNIRNLPPGPFEVRAVFVGFASEKKSVTVVAGETVTLDFTLTSVPYQIEEMVVTATGEQRKLELGQAIGQISAAEVVATQPVNDVSDLLSGRVANVNVLTSSGTTGTGTRIRIRGSNSLSLSNEPIIFVDGVRVTGGSTSLSIATGGQAPSRLNDFNPEEIQNVEVVKGPSAATLYGTEAANGVIRITTKRGRSGAPRFNLYTEQGVLVDVNQYPSNFRGFATVFDSLGAPDGHRTCTLNDVAGGVCTQDSVSSFNVLRSKDLKPIDWGRRQQYGLNVAGGNDQTQYFVSGELATETGTFDLPDGEIERLQLERGVDELPENVLNPNYLKQVSVRANLNTQVTSTANLQISTGYISSDLRLPQNDNNVLGMLPSGYFGTASASDTSGNGGWGFFKPGEIFSLLRNQNVERFTGSIQGTWRPRSFLDASATVGYDVTNRADIAFDPTGLGPAFGTTPLGAKTDNRIQLRTYTVDVRTSANYFLRPTISARTTVGAQYYKDLFFGNEATGERLSPGSEDIDGAAILTAAETKTTTTSVGAYLEQAFSLRDRLFLSGAVRTADGSSFGSDFDATIFPSVQASYIISDESFFPQTGFIDLLRLRAAFGVSGQQPGATDARTFLEPTSSSVDGSSSSAVTFGSLGLAGLKPERSRELEFGFDADLIGNLLNLEVTYYNKRTKDALIARTLAPSLGVSTTRFENLGSVSNKGIEVVINARVINRPSVTWDLGISASGNKNRLEELGEGIPPVVFGVQQHREGYALGGFWARPITSFDDANDDGIVTAAELVIGDTNVFLGSPIPTREASLNTSLTLFNNRIRVGGQIDYRGGHKLLNNTEVFRCTATGNNCQALHDPGVSLEEKARVAARRFHSSFTNAGFIEDAWFVKLREISVTLNAPDSWARLVRASGLTFTLAGRNLGTWTDYSGVDPEVQQSGQAAFANSDFLTQPPVRTWVFRTNVTF